MRPGRFHPGNLVNQYIHQIGTMASMRPGRFHPGNMRTSYDWSHPCLSFNEAGAFPPRKLDMAAVLVDHKKKLQ